MEPRGVDLDHGKGAEGLEVLVDRIEEGHAHHDLGLPAVEEEQADDQVQRARSDGAEDDGLFATEAVSQRAVEDHREGVGPEPCRSDHAELFFVQMELLHDGGTAHVQVVATHVESGVGHTERKPVPEPPSSVLLGM